MLFIMSVRLTTRPDHYGPRMVASCHMIHTSCYEADSGGSYIRNPLSEVLYSGEYSEGVEGPIARGYIADNETSNGGYITLPNVA